MSKTKPSSMFFGQLSEQEADHLSLYIDQDHWGQLFELLKDYDAFQIIKQDADSFLIKIGKHQFNVVRDFHRCIITMGQISTLTKGAAELLCKIANMLFSDRKNRFVIDTKNLSHEEMTWDACFSLQIAVMPRDKAQAERFLTLAQRKNIQVKMTTLGFTQRRGDQTPPENTQK